MAQLKTRPLLPALEFALIVVVVVAAALAFPNPTTSNNQQVTYQRRYGATVAGGNYSFTPPITKYQAINTALASDNWTTSDLQKKTVYASLNRVLIYHNITVADEVAFTTAHNITLGLQVNSALNLTFDGMQNLGEVTAQATNYQPVTDGNIYLRYIWSITVQKTEGITRPPLGYYMVDAATGELVPFPGHFLYGLSIAKVSV